MAIDNLMSGADTYTTLAEVESMAGAAEPQAVSTPVCVVASVAVSGAAASATVSISIRVTC